MWSLPWLLPCGAIYELLPLRPVEARKMIRSNMHELPALVGIEEQSLETGAVTGQSLEAPFNACQWCTLLWAVMGIGKPSNRSSRCDEADERSQIAIA